MKEFCSKNQQTVCTPCSEGSYTDQHLFLGKCNECQSCQGKSKIVIMLLESTVKHLHDTDDAFSKVGEKNTARHGSPVVKILVFFTEYAQKCTPTTNAKCSCRPGFLCSDSVCSTCEKNKCVPGEKVNRTGERDVY